MSKPLISAWRGIDTATLMSSCSIAAIGLVSAAAAQESDTASAERYASQMTDQGAYLSGDYHNHTTCSDGTTSVRTLVDESILVYDLDWFAQTGHGGSGSRDCRFDDIDSGNRFFLEDFPNLQLPAANSRQLWVDTVGPEGIKGDENDGEMWRWQSLIEFAYPSVATAGRVADKATWLGIETNVPGHEHTSMAVLGDQFRATGDAYATGQFEYLWDKNDNDFSGGEEYEFESPSNNGVEKQENVPGDHAKSLDSVEWLRANYARDSYYVPSHVERQGAYVTDENRGYNVEHFRDYHNAGLQDPADITSPSVGMGAEMAPGHQFNESRGSYSIGRPTAGFGTYGGGGAYGVAEVSVPGHDFDGTPLTTERLEELAAGFEEDYGGIDIDSFPTDEPIERYVLGRPGIHTMWDALLGEGRKFSMFYSSDWHSRGAFGPFEKYSTGDAWPGEYQKIWAYSRSDGDYSLRTGRSLVSGMQSGNSWSVMGDLIDQFTFVMCQGQTCATMGQTLDVDPSGAPVVYYMQFRDPEGTNHSAYEFPNPSLLQIGMEIPVNAPVLDNIDLIRGDVTGPIAPGTPEYSQNVSNPTTEIYRTVLRDGFEDGGEGVFTISGSIPADSVANDMYFRVRGTNMPKGTPNETDADGNPLLDYHSNNIPCPFPYEDPDAETPDTEFNPASCPPYLPVNDRLPGAPQVIDYDLEAWTDLWFHGNAIFLRVTG